MAYIYVQRELMTTPGKVLEMVFCELMRNNAFISRRGILAALSDRKPCGAHPDAGAIDRADRIW